MATGLAIAIAAATVSGRAAAQAAPGRPAGADAAKPGHAAARVRKPMAKVLAPLRWTDAGKLASADPFPAGVTGRGFVSGWIEAGAELKMEQQFLAGRPAAVAVRTAPGAPLALTVAEAGAVPVCREATGGCRWLPEYAGRYAIRLRNPGAARVRYVLMLR